MIPGKETNAPKISKERIPGTYHTFAEPILSWKGNIENLLASPGRPAIEITTERKPKKQIKLG